MTARVTKKPAPAARLLVIGLFVAALVTTALLAQPARRNGTRADASPFSLNIVYPGPGAKLPYVARSFVFGSARPGAKVSVNGVAAPVAASGGWIAYLPFTAGAFQLHVVSRAAGSIETADRTIRVDAPLRTLSASPARVDPEFSPAPETDMTLEAGDTVRLFIKASTHARVSAGFDATAVSTPLVETKTPALNPTEKERILGDAQASGEMVAGLYQGELRIPASAAGALKVRYTVRSQDGSTSSAVARGTITVAPAGSRRVGLIILADRKKDIDARPYGIVESEPDGGWLFFPPEHTPFEVTGSTGDYYRVALGSDESAWIARASLRLLQPGTPRPTASVQGVAVRDGQRTSTVEIHLSGRVPFSIAESTDPPALNVRMYGATAGADFVKYGGDRGGVAEVRWDQLPGEIATVALRLRQRTLWGYHAQWNGNDLKLVIKKPPRFLPAPSSALAGLLIVIDPGHSPDAGAIGPLGTQERDVNLAIAKRLAAHLQRLGARTALTRTSNTPMGLYERTGLAEHLGADILISVHNNALPDGIDPATHHGFSVYYYQPQSLELARAIHGAYVRDTSLPDYGLYYDNLALVRPSEEPAVLTESAFIMWPPEEMDLRSPAFQDRLAATLTDGMSHWAAAMRARELGR